MRTTASKYEAADRTREKMLNSATAFPAQRSYGAFGCKVVAAARLQLAGVREDLPDGGAQVAAVWGQALLRQGGTGARHLVVGGDNDIPSGCQQ